MTHSRECWSVEGFFRDFSTLRSTLDTLEYGNEVNPVDGKVYPGVVALPEEYTREVQHNMRECLGRTYVLSNVPLFLRLSPSGQVPPHQAHDDALMGDYTLIVFLNRPEHCQGGTSFVGHVKGFDRAPLSAPEWDLWNRDTNDVTKWKVLHHVAMSSNKGVVFKSDYLHRSDPIGGFGDTVEDSRLVLVGFWTKEQQGARFSVGA